MKQLKPVLREMCVRPTCRLQRAIERLDSTGYGALFITDEAGKMLGLLTDGDLRKAILAHAKLSTPISKVMNQHFVSGKAEEPRQKWVLYLKQIKRRQLPILTNDGRLADVVLLDELSYRQDETPVVIMAGGLGTRLRPLTNHLPKPMSRLGGKPLLENVLEGLIAHNFSRFIFSVNYKAHMIEEYFGDGSRWGANIEYVHEKKRMGTAGSLRLLRECPRQPFLVMNGDVLTRVHFRNLLDFHIEHACAATMAVRRYDLEMPYGVVERNGHVFKKITEKPVQEFYVNAGIYVLEPKCINMVPHDKYYDMPDLFERLHKRKIETVLFPVREYWIDIGRAADLERAQVDLNSANKSLIPNPARKK